MASWVPKCVVASLSYSRSTRNSNRLSRYFHCAWGGWCVWEPASEFKFGANSDVPTTGSNALRAWNRLSSRRQLLFAFFGSGTKGEKSHRTHDDPLGAAEQRTPALYSVELPSTLLGFILLTLGRMFVARTFARSLVR